MRHSYFGRKLSRTKNERQQLFRNLLRAVILHGKIITTVAKAKAIVPALDALITKAKEGSETKRREVFSVLTDKQATEKLWERAKTQFANRQSGFTQMIRLGARRGDATEEVQLRFVDEIVSIVSAPASTETEKTSEKKKANKKPVKKVQKAKK